MALGVMITYLVLDFPDLTVDGSFPLGAVVSARLILTGANPLLALAASALAGAAAGLLTGLIHVKMRVRALFSGIIMMTALYSINLRLAGDISPLAPPPEPDPVPQQPGGRRPAPRHQHPADRPDDGPHHQMPAGPVLQDPRRLPAAGRRGQPADGHRPGPGQGAGENPGPDDRQRPGGAFRQPGAQEQRLFEISMGTGSVVLSLASVILGVNPLRRLERVAPSTKVIIGAILYKISVTFAIACGLKPGDLKLITSLLFLAILAAGLFPKGGQSMLTLENISLTYNPGTVREMGLFRDFSPSVKKGQFLSVVGSNGSGKTTLLNLFCRQPPAGLRPGDDGRKGHHREKRVSARLQPGAHPPEPRPGQLRPDEHP